MDDMTLPNQSRRQFIKSVALIGCAAMIPTIALRTRRLHGPYLAVDWAGPGELTAAVKYYTDGRGNLYIAEITYDEMYRV